MSLDVFHPATAAWFERAFGRPTDVQARAWNTIGGGGHTLIAAPTGSGKTLAAFMSAIDSLVRQGMNGRLEDATQVLYVSPLKALSNDVKANLEAPLAGIREELDAHGLAEVDVRAWVRTCDTPQRERERMRRTPPHILVTTPESLFILLTSDSGRAILSTVHTAIVDEIHAIAGSKRGAHLALSLERLEALAERPLTRVGLSATQKPIAAMARFLVGNRDAPCDIIDTGHARASDLALEVPGSPLEAVMAGEVWTEVYDRLAERVNAHDTTLIFVNTRRLAERAARHLAERLGEEAVSAHHGSLAREHRLEAEQKLKRGRLRALVATASLELGIDIGDVDLVCQLGSPRAIATFVQRVGRSGHGLGKTPKGRLFPLSRDDLVECAALLDAARRGELDRILIPEAPLDVLSQQIVGEVASREWGEAELYACLQRAWPYRNLTRDTYTKVVRMLAAGYTTRRGRRGAYLHHDAVNARLRPRRGARLTALTNAGAIPDQFDFDVVLRPDGLRIGTVNEDFAFESLAGDVFQLGNSSYRVLKVESSRVFVEDAGGQPPSIPFWFGEAPGRSDELSAAVSRLRATVAEKLQEGFETARAYLQDEMGLQPAAAIQLANYLGVAHAMLGALPTQQTIVFERFFDAVGDQHLVVHAPFGSRVNRAWGLALRKRFCRRFNFELQAAALEDSLVLSLGSTHSFALEEVANYLKSANVREVLVQALLAAPMFPTRWRWNANIALAVKRSLKGKRVPPQFQRSDAEDLIAVVFPDQLACAENLAGEREVPDHPLVNQTVADCLHDTMDIEGLERLFTRLEAGEVRVLARDLSAPSPLSEEIVNANPYAFLDDAPGEERRTRAVRTGDAADPASARDLGKLDPEAIERVRTEVWPEAATPDELHDALVMSGFLTEAETRPGNGRDAALEFGWTHLFEQLTDQRRATSLATPEGERLWMAAERLAELQAIFPEAALDPAIEAVMDGEPPTSEDALREIVRSRLETLGPISETELAKPLGLAANAIQSALAALEQEGFALRGQFTSSARRGETVEWCGRRLLARANRYTVKRKRAEIEPVSARDYMRFLLAWHGLSGERREGEDALGETLGQLEGCAVPAGAWETDVLPTRIADYSPAMLDRLCASGQIAWARLAPPRTSHDGGSRAAPVRSTPITLVGRENLPRWQTLAAAPETDAIRLSATARRVRDILAQEGALFFADLTAATGLLRSQVETALSELVALGTVTADSFAGLRALITPNNRRPRHNQRRRRELNSKSVESAGRWSLIRRPTNDGEPAGRMTDLEALELIADVLLTRYGVVFRKVLERESILPPWRELLYVLRRLEARGEVRGGRFVDGFAGEQFAVADAVGTLRAMRRREATGELVAISAADPLNLAGIITPGERLPARPGNRVLLRDGAPIACQRAGEVAFLERVEPEAQWAIRNHLIRRANPASYLPQPSGRL